VTRTRPAAPEAISVLLVDDHTLVRDALRRLLEDDRGIRVVGDVSDGESAVRLARTLAPRVIIMDYVLPGQSGLVTMTRIRRTLPDIAVVMLSIRDEEPLVRRALAAGARGYVAKGAVDFDLAEAVRRVASGEIVVIRHASAPPLTEANAGSRLTTRELEVLALICRGLSARAMAAELGLSVFTVRAHRANIMRTLDIHRTTALVAYAARHRLVDLPQEIDLSQSKND
jgi:two-component system invasion response regulator UvrY